MYCRYCGNEINDDALFCSKCGQPTGNAPVPYDQTSAQPYDEPSAQPAPDGYAIASLVLGILGLVALPLIGGILAVVFGNISRKNNGPTTMARAGWIMGIIGIVLGVVVVAIIIILFVVMGAALMSVWI